MIIKNFIDSKRDNKSITEKNKYSNLPDDTYRSKSNNKSSRKVVPAAEDQQENIENAEAKVDGEEGKKPGGLNALFGGMLLY